MPITSSLYFSRQALLNNYLNRVPFSGKKERDELDNLMEPVIKKNPFITLEALKKRLKTEKKYNTHDWRQAFNTFARPKAGWKLIILKKLLQQDKTQQEIAKELGISPATVSSLKDKALQFKEDTN